MAVRKTDNTMLILAAVLVVVAGITAYLLSLYTNSRPTFEQTITQMETQSEATDTASIEKDLNNTDLSSLDSELNSIEAELNSPSQ